MTLIIFNAFYYLDSEILKTLQTTQRPVIETRPVLEQRVYNEHISGNSVPTPIQANFQ